MRKQQFILFAFLLLISACKQAPRVIYQSPEYRVEANRVVQGNYSAFAPNSHRIESNYQSPALAIYSRLLIFKLSVNEKDNELPVGVNHWVVVGMDSVSPIIKFGDSPSATPAAPASYLPVNTSYTFRFDLSPLMEQFEKQGFYLGSDGQKVMKQDFKGVFLAGSQLPLSWDFVNLESKDLRLIPTGKGHEYSITVKLNPWKDAGPVMKVWTPSIVTSHKPQYTSPQPLVDALWNLCLEEAIKAIEPDSTFRTGAKWGGVWTRDISYSILLAMAFHEPEVAKISLMKKVKRNRIVQDTGSGGAWPVSSDRVVWAMAAWEVYLVTGDRTWLETAFEVVRNSLDDDRLVLANTESGLYRGESSFLDWREQSYPRWMSNKDIYVSENLGTNVLHYQAMKIANKMALELGFQVPRYQVRADSLRSAIQRNFWLQEKGYFARYRYGRPQLHDNSGAETLGEALSILFGVSEKWQAERILMQAPVTPFGVTCFYPQIPGIPPYHNNAIWPFVQAYWNWAAAKTGLEQTLNHGLASIYRAAGLFLTNYENMVATTGDFQGTEINSERMLWSMAGQLAMVYRVFLGMEFHTDGLHFAPVVPQAYSGTRQLTGFKYRNAILDITVHGYGRKIRKVKLNGVTVPEAEVPSNAMGKQVLEIWLDQKPFDAAPVNIKPVQFSLPAPEAPRISVPFKNKKVIQFDWTPIAGASFYKLYRNGKVISTIYDTTLTYVHDRTSSYSLSAVDSLGYESFTSEPFIWPVENAVEKIEIENLAPSTNRLVAGFSGNGCVEVTTTQNKRIDMTYYVKEEGLYGFDLRYSNGSGPWNTDNKCALRSFYISGDYMDVMVMPQRGKGEWSDWGYSNMVFVRMKPGEYVLSINYDDWNANMDSEVNTALIDYLRIIRWE